MNTLTVNAKNRGKFSPYIIAVTFAMILFGFYGTFLPFGLLGVLGFAAVGLLWARFLGFIAHRPLRRDVWHVWLANAALSRPTHQWVTPAVDCNNMCYMLKPSKIAEFSRIFDDSSLKRV